MEVAALRYCLSVVFGVVPATKAKGKAAKVEEILRVEVTALSDPDSQKPEIRKSGGEGMFNESDS